MIRGTGAVPSQTFLRESDRVIAFNQVWDDTAVVPPGFCHRQAARTPYN
jgi:hypothetical protein